MWSSGHCQAILHLQRRIRLAQPIYRPVDKKGVLQSETLYQQANRVSEDDPSASAGRYVLSWWDAFPKVALSPGRPVDAPSDVF